jgi:hypothetical protein
MRKPSKSTAPTVTLHASITSNGNETITSNGFDWGLTTSYGNVAIAVTVQLGNFSATLTGLPTGTTYHSRAYAVNATGTGVSNDIVFTTGPAPAIATPKYVQSAYAAPQTVQSAVPAIYSSAQTSGNLNVIVAGWNDTSATVKSVTDSKGNVYKLAVGPALLAGSLSQSIYYCPNISAALAGANTVTVTFTKAAVYADIRILEYSGISQTKPIDVVVARAGNSATSNSGTLVTTAATDLLIAANTVGTGTVGAGKGFTQRVLTWDGDIVEDRVVTATGSYGTSTALQASGGWVMQMVAFRAAGQ